MENTYLEEFIKYFRNENNKDLNYYSLVNKLFFLYPSKKIDLEILHEINLKTSEFFSIPYHDIKVIGSSHLGFSIIDKNKNGNIKFFNDECPSDVDIAIINSTIFNEVLKNTYSTTNNYTDNTHFNKPVNVNYFRKNISSGFIRPDTIGCNEIRNQWLNFFKDLSNEFDMKISGAIYLDEIFFINKLNNQIEIFKKMKEIQDGIKPKI